MLAKPPTDLYSPLHTLYRFSTTAIQTLYTPSPPTDLLEVFHNALQTLLYTLYNLYTLYSPVEPPRAQASEQQRRQRSWRDPLHILSPIYRFFTTPLQTLYSSLYSSYTDSLHTVSLLQTFWKPSTKHYRPFAGPLQALQPLQPR